MELSAIVYTVGNTMVLLFIDNHFPTLVPCKNLFFVGAAIVVLLGVLEVLTHPSIFSASDEVKVYEKYLLKNTTKEEKYAVLNNRCELMIKDIDEECEIDEAWESTCFL